MKIPAWPESMQTGTQPSTAQPDATNALGVSGASDRMILNGRWRWADGQTHDCDTLRWRSGTATAFVGTVRVGFRDVDLANGPPGRDDGVEDGNSGTHVNPASTTNFTTTLATPRTIAHDERTCVVFDMSAYTSGVIRLPMLLPVGSIEHGGFATFFNGVATTYALAAGASLVPVITGVATDGTVGTFSVAIPALTAAVTTVTFANDDNPDERALPFTLAFPAKRIKFGWHYTSVASGDVDFVLYRDTTAVGTFSSDSNTIDAAGSARYARGEFIGSFQPGTYHLALKPTTTNDVTFGLGTITAGDQLALGAELLGYSTRVDAGAWTVVNTSLPLNAWVDIHPQTEIPAGAFDLGGEVTLDAAPIEDAIVTVVDRTNGLTKQATTNAMGVWTMSVESDAAERYAAMVEYEDGADKYQAMAPFALTAA